MKRRKPAENQTTIAGATRALPADMYDADTLEAINVEQLATATDRMLLRGRVARRRPSAASQGRDPYPRMVSHLAAPLARGSAPSLPSRRASSSPGERARPTLQIRTPSSARTQVFAVTVVIPTLVGIVVGLAALL